MRKEQIKKFSLSLPVILNIITIIAFLISTTAYVYSSGKKEQRIESIEKEITDLKNKNEQFTKQTSEQNKTISDVNGKLDLLLGYFHITDSASTQK